MKELLARGRIAVWIILIGTFATGTTGVLTGDQVVEIIKIIGVFWLGTEAGAGIKK